jgi:hypothetical protein
VISNLATGIRPTKAELDGNVKRNPERTKFCATSAARVSPAVTTFYVTSEFTRDTNLTLVTCAGRVSPSRVC